MTESELRSAKSSLNLGDFCHYLSFGWTGQVAQVFEDETCHLTCRSRVLRVETRHRPVRGVNPAAMGQFRLGWSVSVGLQFTWTSLIYIVF